MPLCEAEIERWVAAITACGAAESTTALAHARFDHALACLERAALEDEARAALSELAHFVVERDF